MKANEEVIAREPEPAVETPITLLVIGLVLLILTTLTFGLSRIGLGGASVPVAMTIALVKSLLIALFFMHLLEQRASNALVFGTAVFFVVLLITVTLLETATRFRPTTSPGPFGVSDGP